jgi:hypothetical protein
MKSCSKLNLSENMQKTFHSFSRKLGFSNVKIGPLMRLLSFCLLVFVLSSSHVQAQFSYVGINAGVLNMPLSKQGWITGNTSLNMAYTSLSFMHRPLRFLSIGLEYGIPITQSSKFDYSDAEVDTQNSFGSFPGFSSRYEPAYFNYGFERGNSLGIQLRFIAENWHRFFVEGRYTFFALEESFALRRAARPTTFFSGESINELGYTAINVTASQRHRVAAPGFAMGFMPSIGDSFYFNLSTGFDLVGVERGASFSFKVPYAYHYGSDTHHRVTFESQLGETYASWFTSFGFGYRF